MVATRVAIRNAGIGGDFIDSAPGACVTRKIEPVASTTPRGLPAWGPRSAPGTDFILNPVALPTHGGSDVSCLVRRKNHKAQTLINQCIHYRIVAGSLWQPEAFRFAP